MVLTARPDLMPWLRRVRFWALALLALVVAHDAVYLAEYGARYHAELANTGHAYWLTFAPLALVVGGVPIGAAVAGLFRLRTSIRHIGASAEPDPRRWDRPAGRPYLGELVGLLPRLFLVVVVGFTLQENGESILAGHGIPGLHVLAGSLTVPMLVTISFLIALAGAWLRWRESVLVLRLKVARQLARRLHSRADHAAPRWGEIAAVVAHGWIIARRLAGRAPPVSAAA